MLSKHVAPTEFEVMPGDARAVEFGWELLAVHDAQAPSTDQHRDVLPRIEPDYWSEIPRKFKPFMNTITKIPRLIEDSYSESIPPEVTTDKVGYDDSPMIFGLQKKSDFGESVRLSRETPGFGPYPRKRPIHLHETDRWFDTPTQITLSQLRGEYYPELGSVAETAMAAMRNIFRAVHDGSIRAAGTFAATYCALAFGPARVPDNGAEGRQLGIEWLQNRPTLVVGIWGLRNSVDFRPVRH